MKPLQRAIALALALSIGLVPPVLASRLDTAKSRRQHLAHQISRLRRHHHGSLHTLHRRIARERVLLNQDVPGAGRNQFLQWDRLRHQISASMASDRKKLHRVRRTYHHHMHALVEHRRSVLRYIERYGVFRTCPIRGYHVVTDNFGVTVRIPHVPVHIHEGDDITSYYGTPVVAPFAGTAVAAPNKLGGLAVKVFGPLGYVYNAHLSRYGSLGQVNAGQVICPPCAERYAVRAAYRAAIPFGSVSIACPIPGTISEEAIGAPSSVILSSTSRPFATAPVLSF
jgi:hypothetical protein